MGISSPFCIAAWISEASLKLGRAVLGVIEHPRL